MENREKKRIIINTIKKIDERMVLIAHCFDNIPLLERETALEKLRRKRVDLVQTLIVITDNELEEVA